MYKYLFYLALILIMLSGCSRVSERAVEKNVFPIKFSTLEGKVESGINMFFASSPWNNAQRLAVNFPEHCWGNNLSEVGTNAFNDPEVTRLKLNADSTQAGFEVDTPGGNHFRAEAVADSMAIRLSISITNNTSSPIEDIRTLVCTRPHEMQSFVDTNYSLTYVFVDGKPVRFGEETTFKGELPPRMPPAWAMNIKGGVDNRTLDDIGWFSADWGRRLFRMVEEVADPPVIALRSRDNSNRWIAVIWEPSRAIFSNPHIPCIHSDPVPPDCPPGETTRADGLIIFHEGNWEFLLERVQRWGHALNTR